MPLFLLVTEWLWEKSRIRIHRRWF